MSIHLSQPDIQLRKEAWSEDVFAKIELAGGVQLIAQQRRSLQANVEDYEENFLRWKEMNDSDPKDRRRLDDLIGRLDDTVQAFEGGGKVRDIVFWRAGINLKDETARLKSLRQHRIDLRKELGRQGRKSNFFLPEILDRLEALFREAGGASTEVSRPGEDRTRISPFISFAWVVFLQAPEPMRPASGQALATAWERIRQKLPPRASCSSRLTPK